VGRVARWRPGLHRDRHAADVAGRRRAGSGQTIRHHPWPAGGFRLHPGTAGHLVLADATALAQAVLARILVGLGDAVLLVAVLGLVPRWFPARRVPLIAQLTTILGQLGQILSAVPSLMLLHLAGWSAAFRVAAASSALVALLTAAVVRNTQGRMVTGAADVRPGDRTSAADRMGPAGYAARILRPHGHAVLDDDVRAAVGRALSGIGAAPVELSGWCPHDVVRPLHDMHRPGRRHAHVAASDAPILAAAGVRARGRADLDRRPYAPGSRPALAARTAHRGAVRGRPVPRARQPPID
jgi:hypothetical protein